MRVLTTMGEGSPGICGRQVGRHDLALREKAHADINIIFFCGVDDLYSRQQRAPCGANMAMEVSCPAIQPTVSDPVDVAEDLLLNGSSLQIVLSQSVITPASRPTCSCQEKGYVFE